MARVRFLARNRARRDQGLRALVLRTCELRLAARAREIGLRACERRLVGPLVDHEQQVALGDVLAFGVGDALDVAAHARAQFDGLDRAEAAGEFVPALHVAHDHVGDADFGRRHRLPGRGLAAATRDDRERQQCRQQSHRQDGADSWMIHRELPGLELWKAATGVRIGASSRYGTHSPDDGTFHPGWRTIDCARSASRVQAAGLRAPAACAAARRGQIGVVDSHSLCRRTNWGQDSKRLALDWGKQRPDTGPIARIPEWPWRET